LGYEAPTARRMFNPRFDVTRWNVDYELELLKKWEEEGQFKFVFDPSKPTLVIDTPPPYLSGKPHVGQSAHYVQIDMVARAFRMMGYNVLFPFYGDRNGLPVEVAIERTYGINPHEAAKTPEGREKFLKLCEQHLNELEKEFVKIWRRLGMSFEYWREGTDSPEYRTMTQETFIEMWRRGLIYEAERPVIWCPRCRTALAEAELEYREEEAELYYIKFPLEKEGEVVVATTRPELLPSCLLLAYSPEDGRYKHLRGEYARVPIFGHEVQIIEHPSVDPDFGSGLMMFCSYGDQTDVRVIRELGLKPKLSIGLDGRMNDNAGALAGLTVREARKKIVEMLKEDGHLVKVEKIVRRVPVCWRCGTPIEFVHVREYFLKQLEFKEELKKFADKMAFYPPEHKRKLLDWIDSLTMDWPISRSRYYATEIPVWRCRRCGAVLVPSPGRYYRPWKDESPWVSCPQCGAPREELIGETKVFDTWFDSSISVLYAAGRTKYPHVFELYLNGKAVALRPQGIDIIRTWLYYALLRVMLLYGRAPFDMVRLNGMGLDEKGEAMHKSKGNVIYPDDYVTKYGADAFRFWAAAAAKLGSDYRFSEQTIRSGSLFATKLLNIARFVSSFPEVDKSEILVDTDRAVLALLNEVVLKVVKSYRELDFFEPINEIYHFTWDVFASHYLELVKARAYNFSGAFTEVEQRSAWYTLHMVLKSVLRLLAPIMPFVTDFIYRNMYGDSVHRQRLPEPEAEPEDYAALREAFRVIMKINSAVWTAKKERNLKLSDPLNALIYVPEILKGFAADIKHLHRVVDVVIGEPEKKEEAVQIAPGVYIKFV